MNSLLNNLDFCNRSISQIALAACIDYMSAIGGTRYKTW